MNGNKSSRGGFTLIEIMLVLVIMSSILLVAVNFMTQKMDQFKREKMVQQIQQIQNAALAYFNAYGKWPVATCGKANSETVSSPTSLPTPVLISSGYLSAINPPWAGLLQYQAFFDCTANVLSVTGTFPATAWGLEQAQIVAGMLPLGAQAASSVVAPVYPPAGVLNNARSFNFGSEYHSGACVPVPTCPLGMTPDIQVSMASVNGVDYPPNNCSGAMDDASQCTFTMHPVSGYSAYVVGGPTYSVGAMPACNGGAPSPCAMGGYPLEVLINSSPTGYWRVCLQVSVQNQPIVVQNTTNPAVLPRPTGNCNTQDCSRAWGEELGTVMAVTRCVPQHESSGSDLTVWSP